MQDSTLHSMSLDYWKSQWDNWHSSNTDSSDNMSSPYTLSHMTLNSHACIYEGGLKLIRITIRCERKPRETNMGLVIWLMFD